MYHVHTDRAGGTQNGVHFAADNRQRLLAEEAELDRMVKELQATLPLSEGGTGNQVDSLFQSVGHVSRAVGTLVNIMTDDEAVGSTAAVPSATARAVPTRGSHQ